MSFDRIIRELEATGILFDAGLEDHEFAHIEQLYDIRFPPDLRAFLKLGLPISDNSEYTNFYNWRDESEANVADIKYMLEKPLRGILFDIEHNNFWWDSWGPKPEQLDDAKDVCRRELEKVPKLIPIYSHRYIPSEPFEEGNPVFSIHQTDMIYYGSNLSDYLSHEFDIETDSGSAHLVHVKEIRFWSNVVDWNNNDETFLSS